MIVLRSEEWYREYQAEFEEWVLQRGYDVPGLFDGDDGGDGEFELRLLFAMTRSIG